MIPKFLKNEGYPLAGNAILLAISHASNIQGCVEIYQRTCQIRMKAIICYNFPVYMGSPFKTFIQLWQWQNNILYFIASFRSAWSQQFFSFLGLIQILDLLSEMCPELSETSKVECFTITVKASKGLRLLGVSCSCKTAHFRCLR